MKEESQYLYGPPDICRPALLLPVLDEREWNYSFRAFLYFLGLLYFFLGVAIVTDIFMTSIETITSKTRKIYLSKTSSKLKRNGSYNSVGGVVAGLKEDEPEVIEVRVWNDTVANLTLMALGTSAPEILLSIIEIIGHNFEAGQLGPGTIVGSAAFNLLIITSICMLALDGDDTRRINRFKVFIVTGLFSFFAYIWMFIILQVISANRVELWEAVLTFVFFPLLTLFAYSADKGWCGLGIIRQSKNKQQLELGPLRGDENEKVLAEKLFFREGKIDKDNLVRFIREVKKYEGLTDEDAAVLAAAKLVDNQQHSTMWYRIGAVRTMSGGRRLRPILSSKLKQVYDTINEHPHGPDLGDVPPPPDMVNNAVIEFHAATVAVKENIGKFGITIWRHGNLNEQVRVRVQTIDGTARKIEDYVPINEIITFEPGQKEKQVIVEIVNDNKWEPNEEFFLRLSLVRNEDQNVELGRMAIMEVTILDDDEPGILSFEKRGTIVKESAGVVTVDIFRTKGSDGEVSVQWRTIDKSAISGRDYKGGTGTLTFKHGEVMRSLQIPIVNDLEAEKDEHFEIELFAPTDGAKIGNINRCAVTITNDDDFHNMMDRLMVMTNTNIDSFRVYRDTWGQQLKDAMLVKGGDIENATTSDYVLHFASFFWKVLFALIPPPGILGGWLCFLVSLACIGMMTAMIGDLATIFGCLVGLEDTMTAITLVALGTSLPDLLGARAVTRMEMFADGCIIHITGSIAVNVLMGVGMPWLVASAYHMIKGTQFIVPAGGLGFSVLLYSICAIIAFVLLLARRNLSFFGKAEIGGPAAGRYTSAGLLISLWVTYIVLSYLQIHGTIKINI
ncbi:sodium/calcium exchanger 2-like isoform X2 [Cimex lectularius]|uniref:Calx-beta domain-containing protein n=1 Tax=Cimex lectularius TaxID=79782 RepID=A0A8I6RQW5_CIMLE|nr:sodium/calcium exchanger 2-like isoform X2 [Cimex lectularius]